MSREPGKWFDAVAGRHTAMTAGPVVGAATGDIGNQKPGVSLRAFDAWYRGGDETSVPGKMMANDDKTKAAPSKKEPAAKSKTAEAAPKTETVKTETVKVEDAKTEAMKPDAAPSSKGMGEGQKPVTQAYKDNWNAIFAKKKKRR